MSSNDTLKNMALTPGTRLGVYEVWAKLGGPSCGVTPEI